MLNKPKRGAAESDVTTAGEGGGRGVEGRGGLGVLPLSVFRYPRRCVLQGYIEESSISFNLNQVIVTGNKEYRWWTLYKNLIINLTNFEGTMYSFLHP